MAQVEIVKYVGKFESDYTNELSEATSNPILESFKENLEDVFKDYRCANHVEKTKGTIVIDPNNPNGKMKFNLKNFCCTDFKNEIKKNIKS